MIPKIIHYCWFGKGKMPKIALRCIHSWRKHLPDYKLHLWDESNFDIYSVEYVKEAYENKKYAFVTDYVRLYALHNIGGIYMDTDVEVIKSFDDLLNLPAFSGFESDGFVPTGIMASESNNEWVKEQLSQYANRKFVLGDGSFDMTTNTQVISAIMKKNGFLLNNCYQVYKDCIHFFPKDYFSPKSGTRVLTLTENTYCIHHFAGSWNPIRTKIEKIFFHKILGPKLTDLLSRLKRLIKGKIQSEIGKSGLPRKRKLQK